LKIAAPAKINLALHVTGRRPDGYHLIESLVTFADVGDVVSIEPSGEDRLTFSGPFGEALAADFGTNLIIKALRALRIHVEGRRCPAVAIHLQKNLPLASGVGGGSADAAAALKGLNAFWELELTNVELQKIGLRLGADVPMCLVGGPLIAKGIGDEIRPLAGFPDLPLLLVNPGVGISTAEIFKKLTKKENEGLPLSPFLQRGEGRLKGGEAHELSDVPRSFGTTRHLPTPGEGRSEIQALVDYLKSTRNDLEAPARALYSEINAVIVSIAQSGALFGRMSGSGATCFGIYDSNGARAKAHASIQASNPDWWVA
jgi:4-diphosphocytidyl-2-C-methyl-D-erythritol kinase